MYLLLLLLKLLLTLPKDNKIDIPKIYMERAVKKCLKLNSYTIWKPRNLKVETVFVGTLYMNIVATSVVASLPLLERRPTAMSATCAKMTS